MTNQNTKRHILIATIEAIEKFGVQNLTTRVIANEAGVNNAALHYYYGTKEELIDLALEQTLNHMLEDTVEIMAGQESIQDRLDSLFNYIIDGVLKYPNLIRAHLNEPLMNGNANGPLLNIFDIWVSEICKALENNLTPSGKKHLKYTIFSVISSIIMAGLLPFDNKNFPPIDFKNDETRSHYIDYLIKRLLEHINVSN